jgi:hypothetical protein
MKRWGVAWILAVCFVLSWFMQFIWQVGAVGDDWDQFFASTFENWQSEFLQLLVQFVLLETFISKKIAQAKEDAI